VGDLENLLYSLSHWERARVRAYTTKQFPTALVADRFIRAIFISWRLNPHSNPLPLGEGIAFIALRILKRLLEKSLSKP
jgi:hypothetical protein